jgi:XTP/dITP diphosphohydrolase
MKHIVLATGNPGKVQEFSDILGSAELTIRPQSDFGVPDAEETGLTFVENALIKARNAATHTGQAAIADDSGLEVDALNGAPGIYSARYAGPQASSEDNNRKLLHALDGLPEEERTARFICLIVYLRHADDPAPVIAQGTWEGRILTEPVGDNGFGYDPVFYVPSHQCSSAQLDPVEKNRLSHRGQAIRLFSQQLGLQHD